MVPACFAQNFLNEKCSVVALEGFCGKTESIFIMGSEIIDLDPKERVVGTGDASVPKYSPLLFKCLYSIQK
jgi:hypothetical protein